jgi:cytochrome c-type biogenesis protein CcmF
LLLWLSVLCIFAVIALRSSARQQMSHAMAGYAAAILATTIGFFAILVVVVARPFSFTQTLAEDGAGMSPALQNYWMAIHPPTLYLGYVTIAIPFAIVVAALIAREPGDAWVTLTRRWALIAWLGLGAGLILGGRWAYEEIGWGGYWAWDPVENAALMPWLTLTAFLHTIMVQERRGMLRFWNAALIMLTFCLSIFGTFLTRSGVLSSVHSFVSSPVGWWFIGFLSLAMLGSIALLFARRAFLHSDGNVDSIVSKEVTFLLGNLLLVSMSLMVLWGVLYPIITSSATGSRIALQRPWYDTLITVLGMPMLATMAIAPLVPWRKGEMGLVARRAVAPFAFAVAIAGLLGLAGFASRPVGLAAMTLGAFVMTTALLELRRLVRARRTALSARSEPAGVLVATRGALTRNRRRFGGYLAHAGIGLLVIAITGSSAYVKERDVVMSKGQRARVGSYEVRFDEATRKRSSSSMQVRGVFTVFRDGRNTGQIQAGRNFYPSNGETSSEVGIKPDLLSGSDLYIIVNRLDQSNVAEVSILVNPLVNWVWIASVLTLLGGIVATVGGKRGPSGMPDSTEFVPVSRTSMPNVAPDREQDPGAVPLVSDRSSAP